MCLTLSIANNCYIINIYCMWIIVTFWMCITCSWWLLHPECVLHVFHAADNFYILHVFYKLLMNVTSPNCVTHVLCTYCITHAPCTYFITHALCTYCITHVLCTYWSLHTWQFGWLGRHLSLTVPFMVQGGL